MRLLLINPNTTVGITERMAAVARAVSATDTRIEAITAPRGVPYIATRAEAAISGAVVLEMLAEHHGDADAAIIAAFGDPGLGGARELFDIPVVGLAEAGMLTACMLGRTFAIVTFSEALRPWYEECVGWHGLMSRCAGVHALEGGFRSIEDVQTEKEDLLVELATEVAKENRADVVVLAGAPLAGLARQVSERIPVPVVDCLEAAVKQAEALVSLNPRKATVGTFRRPTPKTSVGLPRKLGDLLNHA